MDMVSRLGWGATAWVAPVYPIPMSYRTEYLVHYHGGIPHASTGVAVPREVEAIHLANGWAGIGYNWLVDQDGVAYEGRGWDLVGAHCPGHNQTGIGVYVAIGGDQTPSDAALTSVRQLYEMACALSQKTLRQTWHGANYPTDCPGAHLIDWVKAGMPYPEDDMPLSNDDIDRIATAVLAKFAGWMPPIPENEPGAKSPINWQTMISRDHTTIGQIPKGS